MTDLPIRTPPFLQALEPPLISDWRQCLLRSSRSSFLNTLTDRDCASLLQTWAFRAGLAQIPLTTDPWRTWLFLGGRGAGKTRAGAEWLNSQARPGARLGLVGPTLHDVREVMVEGPSGILATSTLHPRPTYEVSRRRVRFGNGAMAYAFSAEDPDSLRGPQFHHVWADEFCAWPNAAEVLAQIRLGLRLGRWPQLVVTTTPRPSAALRRLLAEPDLLVHRSSSAANARNLSPAFLEGLTRLYGGTRLAAQELEGQIVETDGLALWRAEDFPRLWAPTPARLDRTVLAVDPSTTAAGDACGLIVAGRMGDRAHVIADRTLSGLSPRAWADRAAGVAREFCVDLVVAEANQGGEMVRTLMNMSLCPAPVKLVHARLSKRLRAEPVAALYEQGRVTHARGLGALEEEMLALGADDTGLGHSPDRADALVWALTELLLEYGAGPRVGRL